jgi:5-methylthioadenosine/S-adenosylhomocysteine deaminase
MAPTWDLLFSNVLYPTSDDFRAWSRSDLAIAESRIVEIGPELSGTTRRSLDGSDLIAFPGLYNMHTHGHDMLWRGAREGARIDRSWPDWFWRAYNGVSLEACLAAARASYVDSVRSGVTFVVDHLRRTLPSPLFANALAGAGLQGRVHSSPIHGLAPALALPHETSGWFEASLEEAARLPRVPLMLHAQETPHRLEHIYSRTGRSTVETLDDYGLLHSQTFLVHLCENSDSDLQRIAARGAHVVVTPTAEMKMGESTLDPERAARFGLSLLLGTDGPAYNNGNDLLADVKTMALLWARQHGPGAVRLEDLLAAVTWRAAETVGRPGGRIQIGALADLIFLRTDTLALQPLVQEPFENIVSQLVYASTRADVHHVVVDGRLVVEAGRHLTVDEAEVTSLMRRAISDYFHLHS